MVEVFSQTLIIVFFLLKHRRLGHNAALAKLEAGQHVTRGQPVTRGQHVTRGQSVTPGEPLVLMLAHLSHQVNLLS